MTSSLPYLKVTLETNKFTNILQSVDVVWSTLPFKSNYWKIFVFLFIKMVFAFFLIGMKQAFKFINIYSMIKLLYYFYCLSDLFIK